ncbi:MAG: PepSY domain-containing protein [Elusimicrobia bacterium]|nr:PepSY domain-containing protein [Elusimicrobiota bacterium]
MNKIWWKKIHNIFGVSSALFLIMLLVTGVLLNHPKKIQGNILETIALDPKKSERIYCGKKEGLYFSENAGENWNEVSMLYPPQEVVDIVFSPQDSKKIYVLEKWGKIIFSLDGGKIWDRIELPFDAQSEGIELKKLSIGRKGEIALLTSHGWILSKDQGKKWNQTYFDKTKTPLMRLILTLHNGYFFGPAFVWVYDFSAVALLILIISGLILWNISRKVG